MTFRHTLATQDINRGMSLEAIAAKLGHRGLDMTLRYAKIANRTVAEEYFAVTDQVDALRLRNDLRELHVLPDRPITRTMPTSGWIGQATAQRDARTALCGAAAFTRATIQPTTVQPRSRFSQKTVMWLDFPRAAATIHGAMYPSVNTAEIMESNVAIGWSRSSVKSALMAAR